MKVDAGRTQRRTHSLESWWHSGYRQPGVERHQARHSGFEALPWGLSGGKSWGSLAPGWQGFYLFTVIVDEPSHLGHEEPGRQAASDDILYKCGNHCAMCFLLDSHATPQAEMITSFRSKLKLKKKKKKKILPQNGKEIDYRFKTSRLKPGPV